MNILQKFGEYSSCKNVHKIQLLTFKYKPPKQLSWSHLSGNFSHSVKHLGVYLPNDMSQLAEVKYAPLFNKIKGAIKKWNSIYFFSLAQKLNCMKMNIPMWYLYLFQALPVEIDQKEILVIDKIISRFQIHYNFLKSKARLYQTLKLIFMQLKSSLL